MAVEQLTELSIVHVGLVEVERTDRRGQPVQTIEVEPLQLRVVVIITSSTPTTISPRRRRKSVTELPMKPAQPVTRMARLGGEERSSVALIVTEWTEMDGRQEEVETIMGDGDSSGYGEK